MTVPRRRRAPAPVRALPDAGRTLIGFLRTEAGGGVVLLVAAVAALGWANSPWDGAYRSVQDPAQHWVNDGLMTLFFFVVGLEIKRELVCGELRDRRAAAVPAVAALGGMVVPAVLFRLVAGPGPAAHGWGIPMATDIAFAVGVLSLLGSRIPRSLKVFLLSLAIVDDIGAITVIAIFYTARLDVGWLLGAAALLGVVTLARPLAGARIEALAPLALLVWYCTYRSGIHPTIAGVALGLLVPARPVRGRPVLEELETRLHPWTSYLVIPLFALANTGISVGAGSLGDAAGSRLTWAVVIGLVIGKVVGISGATVLVTRTPLGQWPPGVGLRHLFGVAALGGIGFTVSLFVTSLAFGDDVLQTQAKTGILVGSLVAALAGAAVLVGSAPAEG